MAMVMVTAMAMGSVMGMVKGRGMEMVMAITYEIKETNEDGGILSQHIEDLTAKRYKSFIPAVLETPHHLSHLRCEYKRCSFTFETIFALKVAEEMTKINICRERER